MNFTEYNEKIAFHPGYYIEEMIKEGQITKNEFAKKLNMTPETLTLLLNGKQNVTSDIAEKLSKIAGTSAILWLNLQQAYDKTITDFKKTQ